MIGDLHINGKDAYGEWGISFENGALSALMTPPSNKEYIESTSRLSHGKVFVIDNGNLRVDSRDITLPFHLIASSEEDFFDKYGRFCSQVLEKGLIEIVTKYQPTVRYKCVYLSCTQFSQYQRGLAKFSLKVCEPNPKDRE